MHSGTQLRAALIPVLDHLRADLPPNLFRDLPAFLYLAFDPRDLMTGFVRVEADAMEFVDVLVLVSRQ
ncbi:hypothetical protein [Accumulibacter sp.]|uniref:hypothetical protein n=1 Tax=Accumulibacter sp. TaxID=2053492 RepID=UPI0025FBD5E9|nr:hypothetical protein [Accumulibacter sp.]MCM8611406.1 hypothetical protein [Accumulibacter sp.]MCM8634947.1 hypothetical protein [Accumulibacter sp.]MCM8638534.1 hypothetical protein [Accumulibacter sp.]